MPARTPLPGDIVRIRSRRWSVASHTPCEDAALLDVVGCERENQGERARFLLPFEQVERLPVSDAPHVVSPRRWRHAARAAVAAACPAPGSLDSAVHAEVDVLAYQLEPALAVSRGLGARLLIADDVGLGKTVQAGLVIAEALRSRPAEARAIVVCPAGLREQWASELRDRFHLDPAVLDSAAVAASAASPGGVNPWALHQIVITSIDYLKRPEVMRSVESLVWDACVFDEAHALSGRSDRQAAAAALAARARILVMLTATPHSGDDEAFARLTAIGSLDDGLPLLTFRRTRADAVPALPRRTAWLRVRPTPAESAMHGALDGYARLLWRENASPGVRLALAVLMRRACSSAASLARSAERRLALLSGDGPVQEQPGLPFPPSDADDDEPGAALGAPGLGDRATEAHLLERVLALAREAARGESKVRRLERLLRRAGEPAIVFTEYRDTLAHLFEALGSFAPAVLHGGLTPGERRHAIAQFTSGRVGLLLATDAASEGLNLHQRCRLVVNLELPWTPSRLEQRVGRVDRIGQRRPVHAIHLVAADTPEEQTVARLCRRIERAERALSSLAGAEADATHILEAALGPGARATRRASVGRCGQAPPMSTPDLRGAAAAEAARVLGCRRLATSRPERGTRPAVTMRPARHGARRCCLAFRTVLVDARNRHAGETLFAITGVPRGVEGRQAAHIRRWCADARRWLAPVVQRAAGHERAAVEATVRLSSATAARRERAIAAAISERRARLAATLIQRGLFDTRAEKTAAAQAAVVREALARCDARLADLEALQHVGVARCELAFALLVA